ncbi:MAG: hypothetical protein LBS19_14530 [Clostridiales bacterium]|jgi:hypothetical protein|nr:hypothetical protein [Clostridiales bacterium]
MSEQTNANPNNMMESTKLAAFFLWEYSGHQNTLALWYCTEDIASFLDRSGAHCEDKMLEILRLNCNDREYRAFMRHLAYRIHVYTGVADDGFNWYAAERLLRNGEWRQAICRLACGLRSLREGADPNYKILSPLVKNYYN